jgi:hypothetical protein
MNKKEELRDIELLNIHADDQKVWLIGLSLLVFIIFVITILAGNGLEKKMWAVTQHVGDMAVMPDGYHEECYQSVTEESHRFVEQLSCEEGCKTKFGCESVNNRTCGDGSNPIINVEDCMTFCIAHNYALPPRIDYWNETKCVKNILVRDV